MAEKKKTFRDIKPVLMSRPETPQYKTNRIDISAVDKYNVEHDGDEVFVVDETTLRTERYVVKRYYGGNQFIAIKKTKDRRLIPLTSSPNDYYGDMTGIVMERDFVRFHYLTNRSRVGNVFLYLDDANKAIDQMLNGLTFNRLPDNSPIYMVNRKDETITVFTLDSKESLIKERWVGSVPILRLNFHDDKNNAWYLEIGSCRFETKASSISDASCFSSNMHYSITESVVFFTIKSEAEEYLKAIKKQHALLEVKVKERTPQLIIKKDKGKPINKKDHYDTELKIGDNVVCGVAGQCYRGIVYGETLQTVKIFTDNKDKKAAYSNSIVKI